MTDNTNDVIDPGEYTQPTVASTYPEDKYGDTPPEPFDLEPVIDLIASIASGEIAIDTNDFSKNGIKSKLQAIDQGLHVADAVNTLGLTSLRLPPIPTVIIGGVSMLFVAYASMRSRKQAKMKAPTEGNHDKEYHKVAN